MEPITAEKARDMRHVALKKKREERFKQVQKYNYFNIVMKDIEKAANDGKNSVDLYPHVSDFYEEIVQNGSIVPAAEKDFTKKRPILTNPSLNFPCRKLLTILPGSPKLPKKLLTPS